MNPDAPILVIRAVRRSGETEAFPLPLLDFRVEDDERKVDTAKFVIDNGDLRCFAPPLSKWLVQGMILGCRWGYPGRLSREWHFELKKVTGFKRLSLELLGRKILAHADTKTRTWEGIRRSDVVAQIADELGYSFSMQDIQKTDEVFDHVVQARMTDAQFLTWLARREGFEFWMDPDGIHWKPRPADKDPVDVYVYHIGGSNARVLSFAPESDVSTIPARVRVRTYDPRTREVIEEVADNETVTDLPTTGGYSPVGYDGDVDDSEFVTENQLALRELPEAIIDVLHDAYGVTLAPSTSAAPTPTLLEEVDLETGETTTTLKGGAKLTEEVDRATQERVIALPMGSRTEARRIARAAYQEARRQVVKATLTIIGEPEREARQVIGLHVPGVPMFSGKYYVENCVHHRKGGGGYKTILKLNSDGLKRAAGPAKVKTAGKESSTGDEFMGPPTPEGTVYNIGEQTGQSANPGVEEFEAVDFESGQTVTEYRQK